MELEGSIGAFSMRELIEMIVYSSVTGVLEIGAGDKVGQLYFRDGLPCDARYGDVTGFDAAAMLFELRDAPFAFVAGGTSRTDTLWMDPWELIERCEERSATWIELRPYVPAADWVPVLRTSTPTDQVHISEVTWPVLSAVDGRRSVTDIGAYLDMAVVDVATGLVRLLKQNLITMQPPQLVMPEPAQEPEAPPSRGAGGFFERLITKTLDEERRRTSDPSLDRISDPDLSTRVGSE